MTTKNTIERLLGVLNIKSKIDSGLKILASGTFTCNGATSVTVSAAAITADAIVIPTLKTVGGTVGASAPTVKTKTAGTGFTIAGLASDTSVYNYIVIAPIA